MPDEWRWVVSRVLEGEPVRNVEVRFRRADGAEFDGLLRGEAQRLEAIVRQPDTVARIGGDEFAVLLEEASGREDVRRVAGRIATAFMEPVELEGETISVDVSIGGSVYEGAADARTPSPAELLKRTDEAMYRAKKTHGPSLVVTGVSD